MIVLRTNTPKMSNDLSDVIRLFLGDEQIKVVDRLEPSQVNYIQHIHMIEGNTHIERFRASIYGNIQRYEHRYDFVPTDDPIIQKRIAKRSSKLGMYYLMKQTVDIELPWGALTGVRPVRLYRQLDASENGSAYDQFANILDVSESKINLINEILASQDGLYQKGQENQMDVYIGVPFCPSRCSYCSFISHDLSQISAPLDEYVECIHTEIRLLEQMLTQYDKTIRSIYIGGGTPTTLSIEHIETILESLGRISNTNTELTVEAGRADTISRELLNMLTANNVDRISINPQTFNDSTLEAVNRHHSAKDTLDCLDMTVACGFDSINMDIIMGLPSEDIGMMTNTLDIVRDLPLDNLTVHTLARKRASSIKMDNLYLEYASENDVATMVDRARETAYQMGMKPYYMYRQKYMSGNLENVGYSKAGKQCIYNIDIMEETHSTFAIGAGAISKRMFHKEDYHTRYANPKSVEHYIKNIDQIIEKKTDYFGEM